MPIKMTHATRRLLHWELRWIPVEIGMIGFGLYLLLGRSANDTGTFFLLVAIAVSIFVRLRHYRAPFPRDIPPR
jgi:hypothetical protein